MLLLLEQAVDTSIQIKDVGGWAGFLAFIALILDKILAHLRFRRNNNNPRVILAMIKKTEDNIGDLTDEVTDIGKELAKLQGTVEAIDKK